MEPRPTSGSENTKRQRRGRISRGERQPRRADMRHILRFLTVLIAAASLVAVDGAIAQPKDKDQKEQKGGGKPQKDQKEQKDQKDQKDKKPKKAKHENGKNMVGEKIKQNGKHKFHEHGKHTAYVDVKDGKIMAVNVKHAEKGDVPVKKYKTNKQMASAATSGIQPVSLMLTQYIGTTWIGYAYIDDWGEEVIYWFPYDMIYDPYTDAVEYIPAY